MIGRPSKTDDEPGQTAPENEKGATRRTFFGAMAGIAAAGLGGLGIAEVVHAATGPPVWPESNPEFSGIPSAAFFSSGEPLASAGLSDPYYLALDGTSSSAPEEGTLYEEAWPTSIQTLTNPNLLIVIVDQLWNGLWLPNDAAGNPDTSTIDTYTPTLAYLRDNSLRFLNYYAAACACTPSRGTILTGLYARQTNLYCTQTAGSSPNLHITQSGAGFSTFGAALQDSVFGSSGTGASPYAGNVYWVGKWHVSGAQNLPATGLNGYAFKFKVSAPSLPRGTLTPSPNGIKNEGQQGLGGGFPCVSFSDDTCATTPAAAYYGSDADIANEAQSVFTTLASVPSGQSWCLVVSFINPHDIAAFPAYFETPANGFEKWPSGFTPGTPLFTPVGDYASLGPSPYPAVPSPWNQEDVTAASNNKPSLQAAFLLDYLDPSTLPVSGNDSQGNSAWDGFLNNYVWLQSLVDAQIKTVVVSPANTTKGLASLPLATQQNTIVIFTSDHGDYAGSHELHDKGGAAYEEAINVPLYVQIPQQTNPVTYSTGYTSFMCSAVDFFGLIMDLATGYAHWRSASKYEDQGISVRQSIMYKIYHPLSAETRYFTVTSGGNSVYVPYCLYTTDEPFKPAAQTNTLANHVSCIRSKNAKALSSTGAVVPSSGSGYPYAGMFAAYDLWPFCSVTPQTGSTQYEFYDFVNNYGSTGSPNFGELGNQAFSSTGVAYTPAGCPASAPAIFCALANAAYGSGSNGLFGSGGLMVPLTGVSTDGATLLSAVATDALCYEAPAGSPTGYYDYINQLYGQTTACSCETSDA